MNWTAFLPAAILVSLVPGANQLLSLRNAVRQGTVDATVALLGRFTAFALLILVVAAGFGLVLARSAVAFAVIKWLGVAYLGWLGLSTLWRSFRSGAAAAPPPEPPRRSRWALARQEFTVAMANPKALLLFAAFVPQFLPAGAADGGRVVVLGFAYIGIEAVSALAYTVLGGRLHGFAPGPRRERWFDRLTGLSFLGLAGYLAFAERA